MLKIKFASGWVLTSLLVLASGSMAQQSSSEKDLIEPTRPTVANSAEFQPPGVLQIEFGYDGFYRSDEFKSQHSGPLVLRFAAHERLLFELNATTFVSQLDTSGTRESGVGDTYVGVQVNVLKEKESRPALAFGYNIKIPTASHEKQLGTGRTDHRVVMLMSKKFGNTDVNFNAAYLNVGREYNDERASGAQAAVNATYEFENNFGIVGELSGQSEDFGQPKGLYALGGLTYKVNKRLRFDSGMRFGLTPASPRVGFFAGFTVGVGKPFRK